jgi:alcohol dehydrogenase class IV
MQQAAMMAGIPLANAGSGISHALGHTVGGLFHIHHGVMVLLFIPYELQVYSKVTDRYLELCDLLGVRDTSGGKNSDEQSLSNLIEKIRAFMKSLNLPIALRDTGVELNALEQNMDKMLEQTPTDPGFYFGWYDLNRDQFKDIFLNAYKGKLLDMHSDIWR